MSADRLEDVLDDPVPHLGDDDPAIRRLALAACRDRLGDPGVRTGIESRAAFDEDGAVRAVAVELLGLLGPGALELVMDARLDEDNRVVEAAATALGAIGSSDPIPWLEEAAAEHPDRTVREAAVAALGEIGDTAAVPTLLAVLEGGPPQVRRRAVVALTVFDGKEIEEALRAAATDRNPMVREMALMVVARPGGGEWTSLRLRAAGAEE